MISLVTVLLVGTVCAISASIDNVEAKKIDTNKKFKIVKTTKDKKIVFVNGKNQTLTRTPCSGKYSPQVWKNKYYILTNGARGTNGGSPAPAGLRLFENRAYSVKTNKPITPWGTIRVNPKGVPDGEFTCHNPGTRYTDVDFCMQTGREKWYYQRFFMKRIF